MADAGKQRYAPFLVILTLLGLAPAAWGGVGGTPHDMTRITGDIFAGACVYCHIPHGAKGERLWVTSPFGPSTGWGSRTIGQLCYTCHDSTGAGFGAANMVPTAYSESSHGFDIKNQPMAPNGTIPAPSDLPYVASGLLDCTTCHDPHSNTAPFIRAGSIDALCKTCHERENPGLLGAQNRFGPADAPYSLHPTDIPFEDYPANGPTSLEPFPVDLEVVTVSGLWRLGAHRVSWLAGSGNIGCQTCHPVHGGWNYTLGVLPGPPATDLLPIENRGGTRAAFCQACHRGGEALETVGTGGDHPVNRNDGTPAVTYPAGWPSGVNLEVTCSSCHDAHGGIAGTSLLRQANTAEGWCFSCHAVKALLPAYHHSARENDDPAIFISVLSCPDCHGQKYGWTAHNGFERFKVDPAPDRSALCEACHVPENPLQLDAARYTAATGLPINFSGAVQPAAHGPQPGKSSHIINQSDDDSIANCQIKTTPWARTGGISKYGVAGQVICESCHALKANAGLLLGGDDAARLTAGWKTNLLLEPYEDNSPGVGIELPDFVPGPTSSALCRGCHYAVKEGVPPSFVHNPSAHTMEGYVYPAGLTPYGRTTATVLTTPNNSLGAGCPEVSSADQQLAPSGKGVVPGAFSYPAANQVDCDSCHRAHGAHDASADGGKQLLLEYTALGSSGTVPCLECHDTNVQCGYRPPTAP